MPEVPGAWNSATLSELLESDPELILGQARDFLGNTRLCVFRYDGGEEVVDYDNVSFQVSVSVSNDGENFRDAILVVSAPDIPEQSRQDAISRLRVYEDTGFRQLPDRELLGFVHERWGSVNGLLSYDQMAKVPVG